MAARPLLSGFLALNLACLAPAGARADDGLVQAAKSLSARNFDGALPDQPVEAWLRAHMPAGYRPVWGGTITDCGEGTGSATDAEQRDLPLCAEVEIMFGARRMGYLSLMVGTARRGLLKEGAQLYFGYIEHDGSKHDLRRLGDVLKVD